MAAACAVASARLHARLQPRRSPGSSGPARAVVASGSIAQRHPQRFADRKRELRGITPMTVRVTPLARIVCPTMSRRAAVAVAPQIVAEEDDWLGAPARRRPRGSRGRGSAGRRAPRTPPTRQLTAAEPLGPPFLRRQVDRREAERADLLERGLPRLPDGQVVRAIGCRGWFCDGIGRRQTRRCDRRRGTAAP